MTLEEIKQIPMTEVLWKYGLKPNRSGFIHCPFHEGDKSPSMKIYEHDAHCFGCGWNGDQVSFVMAMDNLSFKEAYQSLGGTYGNEDKEEIWEKVSAARKKRQEKQQKEEEKRQALMALSSKIRIYEKLIQEVTPFGEAFCFMANRLPIMEDEWQEMFDDLFSKEKKYSNHE